MELLVLVWRQYRWPFIAVMALSLLSAALGIGLIAFINLRLISLVDTSLTVLPEFLGLLLLLMAVTLGSQLALTTLGHHFVYRLRGEFIKRILDTQIEKIEKIGSASLLAGLTSDVRNITIAFVRLPELVQGIILTFGSAAYLAFLSGKMMLVTAVWMAVTIWGGFVLVARVYKHMATLRETEDKLYHDYQTVLEGRKELMLNRERAEYVFNQLYLPDARDYRHHIIRADTFHLSAVNWSNIMMLGAIGLVFWMANGLGWANTAVAATYSLTLLFLRTPLLSAVGALPTLLSAQVAFNKLHQFALAPYRPGFPEPQAHPHWQTLELRDVSFRYPDNSFAVGPINLTLKRGELVFLIGGKPEVLAETQAKLRERWKVNIVGSQDGYFSADQRQQLFERVRDSGAKIVTVAMGSPRQEILMRDCRLVYPAALYMGVGGTYDVFTGHVHRAPKFWQNLGLEWFYRLLLQPSRIKRQFRLLRYLRWHYSGKL